MRTISQILLQGISASNCSIFSSMSWILIGLISPHDLQIKTTDFHRRCNISLAPHLHFMRVLLQTRI